MEQFYEAIENIYTYKKSMIVLGLTGRTGSGCTTTSKILEKASIEELDLKVPKTYDYTNAEERKQHIIYNYISKNDNWKGFTLIEGSSMIVSFVLERDYECLIRYLEENNEDGKCRLDNLDEIKKELESLKDGFQECKTYSLQSKINIKESLDGKNSEYYNFYMEKLPSYKRMLQGILSKHVCYPAKDDDEKAQLYTYLMQMWGNNIRASGSPYDNQFTQKNYYDIAKRIDHIISMIVKYGTDKEGKEVGNIRICIDALRNIYEAIYFKDNYKNFYLISISTEDNFRKKRLSFLSKKEQDVLEKIECPDKFLKTEQQFYHQNIQGCAEVSDIHIYNPDVDDKKFYFLTQQIVKYIALILHPGLVTPTHIERCMQLAYNAKFNSGCLSRQVGAVITGSDFSIRAVGWNDVPKGQIPCSLRSVEGYCTNKDNETYSNFELCDAEFDESMQKIRNELKGKDTGGRTFSYCFKDVYNGYKGTTNQVLTRSLHAEENAFLQISKYGGSGIKGGNLFTTASPCELCAKKAYQLGITNIYYIDPYPGISMSHILSFGKSGNPKMNLFFGAIGSTYVALYEPRMAIKDELELITGIKVKKVVEKSSDLEEIPPIVSDIKYKKMELTLAYKTKEDIISIREVELEVTGEPINHIEKEIIWTGNEYKGTQLLENEEGFSLEDSTRKISPYKYKILFNKSVMKGESVKYKLKTVTSDMTEDMQPFFSHTIKNPTDKLLISVEFPIDTVEQVEAQEFRDSGREIPIGKAKKTKVTKQENMEKYIYEIENPKLLNTYSISWVFKSRC